MIDDQKEEGWGRFYRSPAVHVAKESERKEIAMKVRIAAVQTKTFKEADEQKMNIERAREYVAEAAAQGAQIICFPEAYPGPWKAPLSYSPVKPLEEMASRHNVYIVAGANWPVPGEPTRGYCSEVLVGPQGLIGRYNRISPKGPWLYQGGAYWDFDYKEATELPVFETPFCKVGILICIVFVNLIGFRLLFALAAIPGLAAAFLILFRTEENRSDQLRTYTK